MVYKKKEAKGKKPKPKTGAAAHENAKAIGLVLLTTFFGAFGQYFMKKGADRLVPDIIGLLLNFPLFLGVALYAFAGVIFIIALKKAELSLVFPFMSLNFVWVTLLSIFLLNESLNYGKIAGIGLIIFGVAFIGRGAR